jgi:(2Fe-2S) ferredoxin
MTDNATNTAPSDVQPQDFTAAQAMEPYFAAHLFVCCNRRAEGHPRGSCAASGAEALRDYMKMRAKALQLPSIRVNMAGCLDRCELGPCVVIYPEGVWYGINSKDDVDRILEQHMRDGQIVSELQLPPR